MIAALFAALLGLIAMRTRGFAFVIITIAALFILQIVAINWDSLTNGTSGITLPLPRWDIEIQNWPFYYTLAALLAASLLLSWWIRRTKIGTGLLAIREDEDKAATIGINTPVYKIIGFVASAVFLGMAGGVYGYYLAFIDPSGMFDIVISVQIILAVVLGGRGTLWGPVLGAAIIEPLNEFANQQFGGGNSRLLIFGGLLALTILLLPKGIIPSVRELLERSAKRGRAALVGARLGERKPFDGAAPAGAGAGGTLLEVKGLERSFEGVQRRRRLLVRRSSAGTITGLIGPNGSGKTTTFNLIGGTMRADAGEVWLDGERIDRRKPWARAYAGIGRTFQITRVFADMTVLENVVAPLRSFSWRQLRAGAVSGEEASSRRRAARVRRHAGVPRPAGRGALVRAAQAGRARPGADARPEADPARRAGGRDQPDPDRADGGDDPRAQRARQDLPDRRAQHAAGAQPLRPGPRARAGLVHLRRRAGRDPARSAGARRLPRRRLPARAAGGGDDVTSMLEIRDVIAGYGAGDVLQGVDLEVEAGSVTCIVGPNGAGKSTVLRAISGLLRPRRGHDRLPGRVDPRSSSGGDPRARGSPRSRRPTGCSGT